MYPVLFSSPRNWEKDAQRQSRANRIFQSISQDMTGTAISFPDLQYINTRYGEAIAFLFLIKGPSKAARIGIWKIYLRVPALTWKLSNSSIFLLQNCFERELYL